MHTTAAINSIVRAMADADAHAVMPRRRRERRLEILIDTCWRAAAAWEGDWAILARADENEAERASRPYAWAGLTI